MFLEHTVEPWSCRGLPDCTAVSFPSPKVAFSASPGPNAEAIFSEVESGEDICTGLGGYRVNAIEVGKHPKELTVKIEKLVIGEGEF